MTRAAAILALLALAGAGCAARTAREPSPPPEAEPVGAISAPSLSPGEILAYREIERRVIASDGRTWVILPRSVLALSGDFIEYRFGPPEGLLGSVLSVAIDSLDYGGNTLWLGTTAGVNSIDTHFLSLRSYRAPNDTVDFYCRYVSVDSRRDVWVVTRDAVCLLEAGSSTWRRYPFPRFTFADLREVAFDGPRIWFATGRGLRRFSCEWRAWDPIPGDRELGKAEMLAIFRDKAKTLWALSTYGLYLYDPSFDTWTFVGK